MSLYFILMKTIFLICGLVFLSSCQSFSSPSKAEDSEMVSNDLDKHECKASAGQTWSQLKQGCIQVFSVAKRLNPIATKENEAIISSFVLLSEDKEKAEIFLPNHHEDSEILERISEGIYANDELNYNEKESILYLKNNPIYTAK